MKCTYYQSAFMLYIIYTRHAPSTGVSICRTYCQSLFVGPLLFALETSSTSEAQVLVIVFVLSSMDRESKAEVLIVAIVLSLFDI